MADDHDEGNSLESTDILRGFSGSEDEEETENPDPPQKTNEEDEERY